MSTQQDIADDTFNVFVSADASVDISSFASLVDASVKLQLKATLEYLSIAQALLE